jgi:hypothetical protein
MFLPVTGNAARVIWKCYDLIWSRHRKSKGLDLAMLGRCLEHNPSNAADGVAFPDFN